MVRPGPVLLDRGCSRPSSGPSLGVPGGRDSSGLPWWWRRPRPASWPQCAGNRPRAVALLIEPVAAVAVCDWVMKPIVDRTYADVVSFLRARSRRWRPSPPSPSWPPRTPGVRWWPPRRHGHGAGSHGRGGLCVGTTTTPTHWPGWPWWWRGPAQRSGGAGWRAGGRPATAQRPAADRAGPGSPDSGRGRAAEQTVRS